jgi:hypothetical protein
MLHGRVGVGRRPYFQFTTIARITIVSPMIPVHCEIEREMYF